MNKVPIYLIYIYLLLFYYTSIANSHECSPLFKKIRTGLKQITFLTQQENDHWAADGYHSRSYNSDFQPLLDERSIEEWLLMRKAQGKSTHILDLFGSAVFLKEKSNLADTLTGARLLDLNDHETMNKSWDLYQHDHWSVVPGDLFQKKTWKILEEELRKKNAMPVDLITFRPMAGIAYYGGVQGFLQIFFIMMKRAYKLLSNNNGMMLIQLPREYLEVFEEEEWVALLQKNGIAAPFRYFQNQTKDKSDPLIRIDKSQKSSFLLPVPRR